MRPGVLQLAATFNPHMIVLARDALGVTQAELSAKLDIGQGTLSKIETGMLPAGDEIIDSLSSVTAFPREFFFEQGRPYGLPPFHYRRRKKLSAKALGKIVAEMNIRRIHLSKLLLSFDRKTNGFIPEIDFDEYQGSKKSSLTIEEAARLVRETWMLPRGPVQNMVEILESNGVIVLPCDFGTVLIDAMSQ